MSVPLVPSMHGVKLQFHSLSRPSDTRAAICRANVSVSSASLDNAVLPFHRPLHDRHEIPYGHCSESHRVLAQWVVPGRPCVQLSSYSTLTEFDGQTVLLLGPRRAVIDSIEAQEVRFGDRLIVPCKASSCPRQSEPEAILACQDILEGP